VVFQSIVCEETCVEIQCIVCGETRVVFQFI